jgi:hypothetical protein
VEQFLGTPYQTVHPKAFVTSHFDSLAYVFQRSYPPARQ